MTDLDQTMLMPPISAIPRPVHDPWGEDRATAIPTRRHRAGASWRVDVAVWLLPALSMAGLGLVGIRRPSLWSDELATWGMATVSWHDMFAVLRWVDLPIAPYYVLIHLWVGVAGASDVALRLPSVFAMAASAALTAALGARLVNRRVGLVAGLIFALLPSATRFAQEARAYALTTFVAVLATYLLTGALSKPQWRRYLGYSLAVGVLGALHPVALLLLVAHGWIVCTYHRQQIPQWLVAAFVGAVPAAPLVWFANTQKSQVAWIPKPTAESLLRFPTDLVGAAVAAVVLVALAFFSLPLRRTAAICTAWAVLPFLGLLAAAQLTPIFLARYLLFTLPAWALLAAIAVGRAGPAWSVGTVILIAAVSLPSHVDIRSPDGHGEATRQLADIIASGEQRGDGVVYGMADAGGNWVGRDALAYYLPKSQRPLDVLMTRPERTDGQLAAAECTDVAWCLRNTARLWIVRLGEQNDPLVGLDGDKEEAIRQRYQVAQVWHLSGLTLALVVAQSPA